MLPTILWKGGNSSATFLTEWAATLTFNNSMGKRLRSPTSYGSMRCARGDQFTHCQEQTNTFRQNLVKTWSLPYLILWRPNFFVIVSWTIPNDILVLWGYIWDPQKKWFGTYALVYVLGVEVQVDLLLEYCNIDNIGCKLQRFIFTHNQVGLPSS